MRTERHDRCTTHSRCAFALLAVGAALTLMCVSRASAADLAANIHPYFAAVRVVALDEKLTIDGFDMPSTFAIDDLVKRVSDLEIHVLFYPPLQFELVKAGPVIIDGVEFEVERPFYIATTELSTRNAVSLTPGYDSTDASYNEFVLDTIQQYDENDTESIASTRRYYKSGKKPMINMSLQRIEDMLVRFDELSGMNARLPAISEWFAAMRCGARTRFWWGDDWNDEIATGFDPDVMRTEYDVIRSISDVDIGNANPCGLKNTIGNVSEVVYPTAEERVLLRSALPPIVRTDDGSTLQLVVGPHSAMKVGGTLVYNRRRRGRGGFELRSIVKSQFVTRQDGNLTGLRVVIECPGGALGTRDAQ